MHLILEELPDSTAENQLLQPIWNKNGRPVHVKHLRPHIYKHLAPSGSFYMAITDVFQNVIAASNSLTATQINSANYFHGYVRFDIDAYLPKTVEGNFYTYYYLSLRSTGYTYSDSAFIGWCYDYDRAQFDLEYTPVGDLDMPFGCEIWESKNEPTKAVAT